MNIFVDNLIRDWAWRVNDGMPDPKNRDHIGLLEDTLRDLKYSDDFISEYITQLRENQEEKPLDDKEKEKAKKLGLVWKGKGYGKEKDDFVSYKNVDGKLVAVDQDGGEKEDEEDSQALSAKDGDFIRKAGKKGDKDSSDVETKVKKPGTLSDAEDKDSDGAIKQKAMDTGFRTVKDSDGNITFKPAPGNASSMMNEIMSGEVGSILKNNPNMTEEEVADEIYKQLENTAFAESSPVGVATGKKDKKTGKDKGLLIKSRIAAKAGIKKHKNTQAGIKRLQDEQKLGSDIKVVNFYGHADSLAAQTKMIKSSDGPFYTRKGVEVPKEELLELIKNSGGGENPSDTATITKDGQGRMMVEFHSDKQTTADIQGSSTPSLEFDKAVNIVEKDSNLTQEQKNEISAKLKNAKTALKEKESEIVTESRRPAVELGKKPISQVLDKINSNPDIQRKLAKSLRSRGKPHPYLVDYLEEKKDNYTDEELLTAFFKASADPKNENEPSRNPQQKLLMRTAKAYGLDPTDALARIRKESLEIMQNNHRELNKQELTLPDGKKIGLGNYIEANNIIDVLHLSVIDKEGKGVGKYNGLFNVNMGGVVLDEDILKRALGVDNTQEFIGKFETGTVDDDDPDSEKYMYSTDSETKEKRISGRNVFVYYVVGDKRIPVAKKTQRGGDGPTSSLRSTYTWTKEMQDIFKKENE